METIIINCIQTSLEIRKINKNWLVRNTTVIDMIYPIFLMGETTIGHYYFYSTNVINIQHPVLDGFALAFSKEKTKANFAYTAIGARIAG
ncbi:MAG: hypothetical protein ABIJ36_01480 [Patescibacteria group bacterium]|nr:hypothetical protein [Patescibacteria group bacterium]